MQNRGLSTFLQSRLFMILVGVLPWRVSHYPLWLVTVIYFSLKGQERRIIRNNIIEVFGTNRTGRQIDTLLRSTIKGASDHYFEKLFLACSSNHQWTNHLRGRIRSYDMRRLDQSLAQNKGVILVTGHFGAVEFLPGLLTLLGYPVAIVAKFKTEGLRKRCQGKARGVGATIIDAREKNSFFLALAALKEGRILITQCDEVECWKTDSGRTINLFKTSFQVDRTVAILHKRSGAPVFFGYIRRDDQGSYMAEVEDLSEPDVVSGSLEETILKRFESLVYAHPDQWYIWKNFHRMKAPGKSQIGGKNPKRELSPLWRRLAWNNTP